MFNRCDNNVTRLKGVNAMHRICVLYNDKVREYNQNNKELLNSRGHFLRHTLRLIPL